jgi:hypothetical protein
MYFRTSGAGRPMLDFGDFQSIRCASIVVTKLTNNEDFGNTKE